MTWAARDAQRKVERGSRQEHVGDDLLLGVAWEPHEEREPCKIVLDFDRKLAREDGGLAHVHGSRHDRALLGGSRELLVERDLPRAEPPLEFDESWAEGQGWP